MNENGETTLFPTFGKRSQAISTKRTDGHPAGQLDCLWRRSQVLTHVCSASFQLPGVEACENYTFRYGRNPLMELPLAVNPTGCARSEPKMSAHVKRFVLRYFVLTSHSTAQGSSAAWRVRAWSACCFRTLPRLAASARPLPRAAAWLRWAVPGPVVRVSGRAPAALRPVRGLFSSLLSSLLARRRLQAAHLEQHQHLEVLSEHRHRGAERPVQQAVRPLEVVAVPEDEDRVEIQRVPGPVPDPGERRLCSQE